MVDDSQAQGRGVVQATSPVTPEVTGDDDGEDEGEPGEDLEVVAVLEHHELVGLEVADVRRPGPDLLPEEDPAHVRPPEPIVRAVRVQLGVGVAVMSAVLARPPECGALGRRGASYEQE